MASYPPADCCTVGVKHEGKALGEIKKIGNTSTYITYPKDRSTDYGVLIIPDVIGHEFINLQLIADQFAANGYFTVIMDPFQGDPVPLNRPAGFNHQVWMDTPPRKRPDTIDPVTAMIIKEMRYNFGVKYLGGAGYCFGAKYVIRFLGSIGEQHGAMIDVGYSAHPSFVDQEELMAINGPLSISAAETDTIFPEEKRHLSEQILKELSLGQRKIPYQINLFSGVEHGFSVRADLSDDTKRFAKEEAFLQAVRWFDHHLKGKMMKS